MTAERVGTWGRRQQEGVERRTPTPSPRSLSTRWGGNYSHTFLTLSPTLFPTRAPLQVHDMIARAALEHPPPANKEPKLPLIRLRVRIKISYDFIYIARMISLVWLV